MRIVTDTNVLISATFWKGASFKLTELIENGIVELVLSREILDEFRRVIGYEEIRDKIHAKKLEINRTAERLSAMARIVEPVVRLDIIRDDPDDNRILECALAGKADFIVSQDKHLLKLKELKGIKIVTPAEFLRHYFNYS